MRVWYANTIFQQSVGHAFTRYKVLKLL